MRCSTSARSNSRSRSRRNRPVLQTDSGEVRTEITTRSIENLPIPVGRNYQNLLVTVPGVSPPANQHSVAANPSRGLTFNVNGSTRNSNNVRIDGALANNIWLPHVTAYVPALDSIEPVTVVTASADASQGMAGGSAVNVQIKSGTNEIHGSLFEFHADNRLKAKPFFLPAGQGKPKYIDNQFGGSIGGPHSQEPAVLFRQLGRLAITGRPERRSSRCRPPRFAPATCPAPRIRSTTREPGTPTAAAARRLPDNIIPADRIDPIAAKIAAAYPAADIPGPTLEQLLRHRSVRGEPSEARRQRSAGLRPPSSM